MKKVITKQYTNQKEMNLINNEEHRIYYVAMSRAKEKLFINIPYLNNPKSLKNLEDLFEFIYLE